MESKDTGKVEETKKEEKQKEFVHPDTGSARKSQRWRISLRNRPPWQEQGKL